MLANFDFTGPGNLDNSNGLFGALNYLGQPLADAPKYHALLDAANGSLFAPAPLA
jgi:hypothetical protein